MSKLIHTPELLYSGSFFLFAIFNCATAWPYEQAENCAEIYSQANFMGNRLSVGHGAAILDLSENYFNSDYDDWRNSSESVKIHDGCTLTACNDRYMGGTCEKIQTSQSTSALIGNKRMSSLSCTCPKNCESDKCLAVKFGKAECAKAFIETGCNTCLGISLQFRNERQGHIGSYASKGHRIKSLVVKSGCKLLVYDEMNFGGEETIVGVPNYSNYIGKIESYDCQCSPEALNSTNIEEAVRSDQYPPMIEVPANAEEITEKMTGPFVSHKGMQAALLSSQNGRSPKNAYILLLGMTGSGKSATINFLFNNASIAAVGETESVTSEIHEYQIPVPIPELGIQNSELRIIDTPGLGDTRGLEFDAQFLATLENYLKNHEELKDRVPNVVLVFAKFSENRFTGDGANFVKMLRGVDFFGKKLFDPKFSNVVIVLTHYMSETVELTRSPWSRMAEFQKVVQDFSLFPKPVVVVLAENKPDEEGLPIVNGFYRFPNQDSYPKNLIEKIQQLTSIGGDPIGEAIIRNGFKHPDKFRVSTTVNTTLLNSSDARVGYFLSVLTAANYKIEETEVSRLLAKAFNEVNLKLPADTLPYLQRVFNVRNIFTKSDVPTKTEDILILLRQIRQSSAILDILDKAVGLKPPILRVPFQPGNSYHDTVLPTQLIKFNASAMAPSVLGHLIPTEFTCDRLEEMATFKQICINRQECLNSLLSQLGILGNVNPAQMSWGQRPGFNLLNSTKFTAIVEIRKFKLILNQDATLHPEFVERVRKLPEFDPHDHNSFQIWKQFFNQYGTHMINSVYGGGAIQITLNNQGSKTKNEIENRLSELVQYVKDLTKGKYNKLFQNTSEYSLEFQNGGDSPIIITDLVKLRFLGTTKVVQEWVESLTLKPKVLDTTLSLIPISDVAKRVNLTQAGRIMLATKALMTTGLIYTPRPPPTRDPLVVERERIEKERREAADKARIEVEARRLEMERIAEEKRQELERARLALEAENRRQAAALEALRQQQAETARIQAEEQARLQAQIAENNRLQAEAQQRHRRPRKWKRILKKIG